MLSFPSPWLAGALLGAGLAAVLLQARVVTFSGAVVGAALTTWFVGRGGPAMFASFALLVVGGSGASLLSARIRGEPGTEEPRHGGQALANVGPAALLLLGAPDLPYVAAVWAACGSAFSDTVSSEFGILSRRPPRLLLLGPIRETGDDGAMSRLGTCAGIAAAAIAGGVAWCLVGNIALFVPVAVGATAGNLADSVLGALIERRFPPTWGNDMVNLLSSATGGVVGLLLA